MAIVPHKYNQEKTFKGLKHFTLYFTEMPSMLSLFRFSGVTAKEEIVWKADELYAN